MEYSKGPDERMIVVIDWNAFDCRDFSVSINTDQIHSMPGAMSPVNTGEAIEMTVMTEGLSHRDELEESIMRIGNPNFVMVVIGGIEFYTEDVNRLHVSSQTMRTDMSRADSMYETVISIT